MQSHSEMLGEDFSICIKKSSAQLTPTTFFQNFRNMHNSEWEGTLLEEKGSE